MIRLRVNKGTLRFAQRVRTREPGSLSVLNRAMHLEMWLSFERLWLPIVGIFPVECQTAQPAHLARFIQPQHPLSATGNWRDAVGETDEHDHHER